MFDLAWLLLAFPALGALINLLVGQRLDRTVIGWIAAGAVGASFVVSLGLFFSLMGLSAEARQVTVDLPLWGGTWLTVGDFDVPAALLLDPLSITMALIVTGVGTLIHIYSISYMEHEDYYQRFFVYLNFFIFAMLILVLSNNFLGVFVGWEGVGLASFLLIGFYFERRDDTYGYYADCGKKAFLVNRVGDFGVMLAIMAVWVTVGSVTFLDVFEGFEETAAVGVANLVCFLLLLGAAGKSAQIPLYVWLPDAMAGPTPVSALIHAATMVTAGIYMIAGTHTLWHMAEAASLTAAWIGGLTALLAATIAIAQTDLKKILAYSTISQLGFMMMGVGVGAYGAAIFHLTTHAFFKALLFLAAGSVMHALHGELDIRKMGGLRDKMPATANTFIIGAAALAGLPPLAGFFSKDAILLGVIAHHPFLYAVGLVAALCTAFYSFRAVFVPFFGQPRDQEVYDQAHESPSLMTIPLWILAGLAVVAGLLNLPGLITMEYFLEPALGEHEAPGLTLELLTITLSLLIAVFGSLLAYALYLRDEAWARRTASAFGGARPLVEAKYYVDEAYDRIIIQPLRSASTWFADEFDQRGIDAVVNGTGRTSLSLGEYARRLQNGSIPTYALSILVGVVVVIVYFVFA